MVRIFLFSALLGALATAPGLAEEQPKSPSPPCVEVQIGQDSVSRLNCLNSALQRSVEHEHNAPVAQAPLDARSESNKVGTFNDAAAHQKMGNAYGVSSQPQRPKSVFTSPLLPSATP
jgi:hypothetical protein